ncbi:M23 family metallopeptidase [Arsenicitalea aurantiaca]|uniref:M23 family metallopeptidase n=1 Tax=Arsenicitalea aurantiaca TaxID=1783274 RepID=A0A433XFR7_9HYPH|nr:M23 family metallopeptidase [Arsenicitalea aurantiaca]RUT32900.1 M23 family metallopeptidase [Arsenicitalea aurantiaca]
MSKRMTGKALKGTVALVGILAGAVALSGCTAIGGRAFGDPTVTGSASAGGTGNLSQPMPMALASSQRVAAGPFTPPAEIGGGGGGYVTGPSAMVGGQGAMTTVSTETLPPLNSSNGNLPAMPAQQALAPAMADRMPVPPAVAAASAPNLVSVSQDGYTHVIESGESLYTIARRYDVTAQSIIQANGLSSPDKIVVGQRITIPGRSDLGARSQVAANDAPTQSPILGSIPQRPENTAAITDASLIEAPAARAESTAAAAQTLNEAARPAQQQQVASLPAPAEPQMSGAEKFRWPVSGRVITDFASSRGTGINIEAPEGATIRAAENGTVIYTGSGVEGYGNLILIRHPNGYVSAYAHLGSMTVNRGDVVNRGDSIGTAGTTGSVTRPQLHFELRKGATPVDPMPLLAS